MVGIERDPHRLPNPAPTHIVTPLVPPRLRPSPPTPVGESARRWLHRIVDRARPRHRAIVWSRPQYRVLSVVNVVGGYIARIFKIDSLRVRTTRSCAHEWSGKTWQELACTVSSISLLWQTPSGVARRCWHSARGGSCAERRVAPAKGDLIDRVDTQDSTILLHQDNQLRGILSLIQHSRQDDGCHRVRGQCQQGRCGHHP